MAFFQDVFSNIKQGVGGVLGTVGRAVGTVKDILFNPPQQQIPSKGPIGLAGSIASFLPKKTIQPVLREELGTGVSAPTIGSVPGIGTGGLGFNVRPLITTQPLPPPPPSPTSLTPAPPGLKFEYPQYQVPNIQLPRDPRTGAPLPAPSGAPAVQAPGGGGFQAPAQQGAPGAGVSAFANFGGGQGGPAVATTGIPQEDKSKAKKQPQFTMVTLDQARQLGLTGAGQSGVFKDQQGNFYGISNVQVATQFGAPDPVTGKIDVTRMEGALPFRSSLETGPISAEALLKGGTDKLIQTDQETQNALQAEIDKFYTNAPPTPQQPVIETPEQKAFIGSSSDPFGLQAAMDASRAKNGLPALENERINAMKNIQGLTEGIQKIIKDIRDNPDLPKGLAERRITEFSRVNGITLQNLQSQLQIINTQIDQANEAVNREFGIKKFGIEKQISTQEQARDNARQQISQYISSGAFAEFSDAQLQNIADNKIGYNLANLKTMRDALKSGNERKIADAQAKLDIQEERLKLAQEKAAKPTESVIPIIQNKLLATRGTDGFVNPVSYLDERRKAKMSPTEFDQRFGDLLSPQERTNLGIGGAAAKAGKSQRTQELLQKSNNGTNLDALTPEELTELYTSL